MKTLQDIIYFIFRNTRTKRSDLQIVVLCLGIAILFWFFTALNKQYDTEIEIPVNISYNNDSLIATGEIPDKIQAFVKGSGWSLIKITTGFSDAAIHLNIQTSSLRNKISTKKLLDNSEGILEGLKVISMQSDSVYLPLEKFTTKKVKVEYIDDQLIIGKDKKVLPGSTTLSHDSITLSGAESALAEFNHPIFLSLAESKVLVDSINRFDISLEYLKRDFLFIEPSSVQLEIHLQMTDSNTLY